MRTEAEIRARLAGLSDPSRKSRSPAALGWIAALEWMLATDQDAPSVSEPDTSTPHPSDPRLTEAKRTQSRHWQTLATMLAPHPEFRALGPDAQRQTIDRAWQISETEPASYAVSVVLAGLRAAPDLSEVSTAALLAEVAARIDR